MMAKDKFKFKWKIGDKCFYCGAKYKVTVVASNTVSVAEPAIFAAKPLGIERTSTFTFLKKDEKKLKNLKPRGKTKKRYKSENLKWQQDNIKMGDWVKRISEWSNNFQNFKKGDKFKVVKTLETSVKDENCLFHLKKNLKPCKPPKPKDDYPRVSLLSFRNGKIMYLEQYAIGSVSIAEGTFKFVPEIPYGDDSCAQLSPASLRRIAELLEEIDSEE